MPGDRAEERLRADLGRAHALERVWDPLQVIYGLPVHLARQTQGARQALPRLWTGRVEPADRCWNGGHAEQSRHLGDELTPLHLVVLQRVRGLVRQKRNVRVLDDSELLG